MKMKVATLFLVYAVLAAGTPSAAGGGDVAAAAPEDERGVVYGARGPDILLKPDVSSLYLSLPPCTLCSCYVT
ncbi:uncharacterized protein J3D65DRAFT_636960, partial [Phyllosticta citribraziliensis]